MKNLVLLLLGLSLWITSQAQDIIIKKNGEEIPAKILEINPEQVRYQLHNYPDGPTITALKKELFMIKYANGTKEVFNAPTAARPQAEGPESEFPAIQQEIKLGGPRIGFTAISGRQATRLRDDYDISPVMTQFGWQFETRLFRTSGGLSGLAEFVPLIGGLEQGKFLPSLSGLIGLRGAKGMEFGVGPNVSLAGTGLVFALGTTFHSQGVNFPLNLAVVPGNDGTRISLLFGFNSRRN